MLTEMIIYLLVFIFGLFGATSLFDNKSSSPSPAKPLVYSIENIASLIGSPKEAYAMSWIPNLPDLPQKNEATKVITKTSTATTALTVNNKKYISQTKKIVSYRVYGRKYKTLGTSKNYQVKGIASWYGPGFHRRTTSSGERYNMFKMTAAHKTLPLATYVQVTNLVNGKRVVVKVNDRGPFVGNRVIDLSYAAAKKIGMVGLGIAPVTIKALG